MKTKRCLPAAESGLAGRETTLVRKKRQERMAQISFIKEISYQKPYSTAHDTSTSFIVKMLTSVMHYLSCEVN